MTTPDISNFTTAREQLLKEYRANPKSFLYQTRPYWSTITVSGYFIDGLAGGVSHFVVPKNQRIRCFDYAVGQMRDDGFGGDLKATYTDTNLSKARQTNSTEDFVIEGVRVSVRDVRLQFAAPPAGVADDIVLNAYAGKVAMMDIGAVVRGPQFDSPLRLEDSLGRLIRPRLSLSFIWDGEQQTRIGLASHAPELQAGSMLTTAGLPTENNEYRLPEGWIWRKSGKDNDTELNMQVATEADCVFVVNGVVWPGGTNPTNPVKGAIDLHVELEGFALKYPSKN
jgi:hypothetical protein